MRFMRVLFLLFFWWASLTMSAKNNIYGNKTEQRAIKMAYTLLQFIIIQTNCVYQILLKILNGFFFQIWLIIKPNKF